MTGGWAMTPMCGWDSSRLGAFRHSPRPALAPLSRKGASHVTAGSTNSTLWPFIRIMT
jgi:hypothetical protein